MKKTKERTLSITCTEVNAVTKKQHSCFIHNLIADAMRPKPLITWKRDPKAETGSRAYYTNGLAAGTLITLRGLDDQPGAEFTYSRHGKLIYKATEANGDVNCDMHLMMLLHKVTCAVTWAEAAQKPNPMTELMNTLRPKPEPKEYAINIGDVFRSIDVDELVSVILDQPSMLSVGFSQSASCPERVRKEALIRATVSYLQNVQRKDTGILMTGFGLKHLSDGKRCGHLVTEPLSRIANAYIAIQEDQYYSRMKPAEANLKFAKDIIVNLLAGV